MNDSHNLQRFVEAQEPQYARVVEELSSGRKRSHWMWYIFPQLEGLGFSMTARRYGISGLDEAKAYLAHPVLGPRLRECTELVLGIEGRSANQILGHPDDLKFRSSMTLFSRASAGETLFDKAIDKYFAGDPDAKTLQLLQ
jgi:uncharacterized protein (DUF1810 family)